MTHPVSVTFGLHVAIVAQDVGAAALKIHTHLSAAQEETSFNTSLFTPHPLPSSLLLTLFSPHLVPSFTIPGSGTSDPSMKSTP